MTVTFATATPITPTSGAIFSPASRRAFILLATAAALIASLLATGSQATNLAILHDGTALTRLMRFMAAIKGVMALAAAAAVLWRLGAAISLPRFGAYVVTCASMAAGPGLIWGMAHIGLGAILLHGGLFATIILFWRDPAVGAQLARIVDRRRLGVTHRLTAAR
jgi:hypothetical protein